MRHPVRNKEEEGVEIIVDKDIEPHQEEENVSLVRLETLPDGTSPLDPSVQQAEEDEKKFATARYHEELLQQAGSYGRFQRFAMFMCGIALASDAVELFAVPYILPSAEQELCLNEGQKAWLEMASLIGMLAGGFTWGPLGDALGRRRALVGALSVNAVFGVVAAFMPTFDLFLITRLCSGIGIGGSLPVVFAYFAEFLVRKRRGFHLSLLLSFWAIGGILVAFLSWAIIPNTGTVLMHSKGLHFGRWRLFLLACSIPAAIAAIGVGYLPESPRFLLEAGRGNEALYVYRQIYAMNCKKSGADYQLTAMELPSQCPARPAVDPSNKDFLIKTYRAINTFLEAYAQMWSSPNLRLTLSLLVVWATISFGFYGMSAWFPAYFNHLRKEKFGAEAINEKDTVINEAVFNSTLQNVHFSHSVFVNVQFVDVLISHSNFHNCSFWNCTFSDVRSSRTSFKMCDFEYSTFIDTDLYAYKFESCIFNNYTRFFSTKGGCDLDFDVNVDMSEVLKENTFAQIAVLFGTFISALLLDRVGRVKIMGLSLLLSVICVGFVWFVQRKDTVLACELIFSCLSICGWNALDVLSTEAYPANIRTTSYGFFCSMSRMAAILGNVAMSSGVPAICAAMMLLAGTICAFHLPETKDHLL